MKEKLTRILFVDDEQDITTIFKRALEYEGYSVDAFNSPEQAIASFKPAHYGLALLDIRMPGMNGFELARRLWQIDPDTKVCFLTAFEIYEEEARKVFKHLKTYGFIKKPVSPKELAVQIQKVLLKA